MITINRNNYNNLYELKNYIQKKYKLPQNSYYLLNNENNKIIRTEEQFFNSYNTNNLYNIELIPRIKGGKLNPLKFIFKIFKPIIAPLRGIANAFLLIIRGFVYMFLLLVWIIKFIGWLIMEFLALLQKDFVTMITSIVYIIFDALTSVVKAVFYKIGNNFGGILTSAIRGADNVPDESKNEDTEGEYFKKTNYQTKCYRTSDGLVPFSVVIATILCPPVGVFMEYGLYGIINIVICAVLTLVFYFPGLIYALILLYC